MVIFHSYVSLPEGSWLVVSAPLKNISQWEGLSDILWKKMFQTTNLLDVVSGECIVVSNYH